MNELYIAKWPDGTISIVNAENKKDVFYKLDSEGDPSEADITKVSFEDGDIHITTHFTKIDPKDKVAMDWGLGEFSWDAKKKKIKI